MFLGGQVQALATTALLFLSTAGVSRGWGWGDRARTCTRTCPGGPLGDRHPTHHTQRVRVRVRVRTWAWAWAWAWVCFIDTHSDSALPGLGVFAVLYLHVHDIR